MQKLSILFVLAMCLSLASAQSTWSYCPGTGAGSLSVSSVTLNPDPPVLGQDDVVTLTGTLNETLTAGNINLVITYYTIPVFSGDFDVCASNTCPLGPGAISASITVSGSSLPPIAPPGNYVGTATFTDQSGTEIACVQVDFTLS